MAIDLIVLAAAALYTLAVLTAIAWAAARRRMARRR